MQRHVGPRLSNSGYPASGDDGVAAGAAKNLRSDCVLSDDGQIADFRPITGGLLSSERGGGAAGSAPSSHRPIMRRDKESIDCDMLDLSNAEPSTPLKHCMTTADGSPLPTDAMLVDQDERNPVMPLSSADCPVPIDQPPRNKRCPKAKKPKKLYPKRQGGDHRREFQGQGWQSRGPPPSDSSL